MRRFIKRGLKRLGYEIHAAGTRSRQERGTLEPEFLEIWEMCRAFTMTSIERGYGLYSAVRHVANKGLGGDFVECGVWRGGSSMIMAHTLLRLGESRPLYLYDTYEGMSQPTDHDIAAHSGQQAKPTWEALSRGVGSAWCDASLEEVEANLHGTGYPAHLIHLVKGKVEDTLPASRHDRIALLRLDTDWYESTKVEMELLFPKLVQGGVLILDDYGHWQGARKAVDDYLARGDTHLLLARLDYTGRMAVKC